MTVHSFEDARRQREEAVFPSQSPPLKDGDGSGTSGGVSAPDINLEPRISRLEGAAVAAFVFLIVTFGSGYVLLSNQAASNTERIAGKLDTMSDQLAAVRTDVAVLKERTDREETRP